ncbi:hypothetical protein [Actinomadura sp. HBU206391]|uniref:hypothetical protein n=1 Tax=Actinomadura sp. HBU206391 TaxID=2731692 RepID=UPI00164F6C51|nr:hypothetical protein [Actinomadura sp. HBU206391]MBC6458961.1 hypothetical protein [Actinomadura sp. HBU206391]
MNEEVPTRVVLYSALSGSGRPVAEFIWNPEAGVSLHVIDPQIGSLAQDFYDQGVPLDRECRSVGRDESETFMRTLLEPRQMTYYLFVDESDRDSTTMDD